MPTAVLQAAPCSPVQFPGEAGGLGISGGEQLACTKLGRSCCDVKASEGFVSPPEAFSQQLSRPTNWSGHKTH